MMRKIIVISFLILIMFSIFGYANKEKEYLSPDGKYRTVIPLPTASHGARESGIVIKTKDGKILCSKSYVSEDGDQGYIVEKAAWTPDSKFFVYSMTSSGGHQPWHCPTDFISITNSKVYSLDDLIGYITNPNFELAAPDIIMILGQDNQTFEETKFKISLNKLVKNVKK
jgi:hypothetical protein